MQEGLLSWFLGIRLLNFGPMYLMECMPYVVVLNLGMANSSFLSEYLVSVIWVGRRGLLQTETETQKIADNRKTARNLVQNRNRNKSPY